MNTRNTGQPVPEGGHAPTAQRLLDAARRLLERSGLSALTQNAIAREAGEKPSLIHYYFGSKGGLLVALVEWLFHDLVAQMSTHLGELPPGQDRLQGHMQDRVNLIMDESTYRLYFELLSYILHDPQLRPQLALNYIMWRQLDISAIVPAKYAQSKEAATLAAMTAAMTDGLALQRVIDPGSVDVELAVQLWTRAVRAIVLDTAGVDVSRRSDLD